MSCAKFGEFNAIQLFEYGAIEFGVWIVYGAKESSVDFLVSFLELLGSFLHYFVAVGAFSSTFPKLWQWNLWLSRIYGQFAIVDGKKEFCIFN